MGKRSRDPSPASASSASSSSSESDSDDERRRRKRHREKDDREKRRDRRKDRKDDRKERKRSKHKSASSSSSSRGAPPKGVEKIGPDDYFRRSSEFRAWLRDARGVYLDELSGDAARDHFASFVRAWNKGRLPDDVYDGSRESAGSRTRFKWGFADKLDPVEMGARKDAVEAASSHVGPLAAADAAGAHPSSASSAPRRVFGAAMPPPASSAAYSTSGFDLPEDAADRRDQLRAMERASGKALRKHHEMVLEELVPKATGREAMLEKKRERAAYTKRSRSPDMPEYSDADLLGGGDDFQSRLRAQKAADVRRQQARQDRTAQSRAVMSEKVRAYQERESNLLAAFREMAKNHKMGPPPPQ